MVWNFKYAFLIFLYTFINYFLAIKIEKLKEGRSKKFYLYLTILLNFSFLFVFKYFNFISISFSNFLNYFSFSTSPLLLDLILPVGISFYTFQTVGYVIDVYNKKIKAERHFGIFALFVSFFPQLVAGPIERAKNLLPQFRRKKEFDLDSFIFGFKIIIWGFFLKVVIADRLSILVDQIFNNVSAYTGLPLIIATYFFAFQILCDFSGYSLIAIGCAKMLGFDLMENFRRPYFAKSIGEFWKRWHISLSTWFQDYLYIPLGGNRVKIPRWGFNVLVVFIISGLWHGANWTFIIWGALHGFYYLFSRLTVKFRSNIIILLKLNNFQYLLSFFNIIITFHLVLLGWIFFRANSLSDAIYIINNFFVNFSFNIFQYNIGLSFWEFIIAIALIVFLIIVDFIQEKSLFDNKHFIKFKVLEPYYYISLIYITLLFGIFKSAQFIYFQF
ncbi:MAG: MBOAT family protein [Candidatus Woesearchaeota archaeon]|nr:MBOAT family protein [Candidatus Woesearchaeota archaeon]